MGWTLRIACERRVLPGIATYRRPDLRRVRAVVGGLRGRSGGWGPAGALEPSHVSTGGRSPARRVRDVHRDAAVAASAMRVRAERRVGQLLAAQPKAKGGAGMHRGRLQPVDGDDRLDPPSTLDDQGISRDESSRFQRLADVDDDRFGCSPSLRRWDAVVPPHTPQVAEVATA